MITPVSGRKPLAGSSVVIRHCSAAPRSRMPSWLRPEVGEGLAGRDPQLRLDQVDVGDLLGDRVLDLDPRVHLDEDVVAVRVEQELDGAGVAVADLRGEADRVGADPVRAAPGRGSAPGAISTTFWWRRCTEQSRSKRWITLPGAVGEDLHLDVARLDDGLLDEDGRVAERALGLAHAGLDRLAQVLGVVDPAHAAAATAGDRLDEQRVRQRRRPPRPARRRRCDGSTLASVGTPAALAAAIARALLPVSVSTSAVGPTKVMPALAQASASAGFSRQEAVAGVDRVGAGPHRHRDDRVGVEVGAHRVAALADLVGLVGLEPVLGPAVLVREDRDRAGAELVGRPERADRDLAAVGDEHLGEHGRATRYKSRGRLRGSVRVADASRGHA